MAYTASQGAVISMSVDGAALSQRQIDGVAQSMNNLSSTVQSAMRNLAAGVGIGGGLVQIVQLSDEYTKLTSQLRLATDSTHAYVAAYADVKRIATDAQADLGSTGMLYARIAKSTNELGIGQKRVADITEVVNLALKVSAATTEEAASANLQLSQAFASGTLRGEEFNAVNEAAPRLMQALADGMGVPIGALKQMASDGLITSQVMADVLPKSLGQLREEAQQVQTISGAFQVLKNNVLEFTATNAQANGSVAVITGGINLLSNNLVLLVGALTTITAVKTVNWLTTWTTETYKKIAADQASRAATVAAAQADLARIVATGAQAAATQAAIVIAREEAVARLAQANTSIFAAKAAIQAATAAGVQTFALRTLRIATGELAEAEAVRGAALAELAVLGQQAARVSAQIAVAQTAEAAAARGVAAAQAAAGIGAGLASRALGLLGGPIGAVVTVLGVAATAWSWYQSKQQEANASAVQETETSTTEIIAQLDRQTAKLRERLELQKQLGVSPKEASPAADRAAAVLAQINDLTSKHTDLSVAEQAQLYALGLEYNNLTVALQKNKAAQDETDATGKAAKDLVAVRERLTGVNKQYLEDLQTMQAALEKGAISQAEYVELVKKLAVETYKSSDAGKEATSAANKEREAFASLISSIREKTDANRVELKVGEDASESQKATIKLDQELASGKLKLSAAHLARARAALVDLAASEQALKLRDAERDIAKYIQASTQARSLGAATLAVEYSMYGKSADARELAMVKVRAEADQEKKLAEMRLAKKPITDQMIADLNAETKARIAAEQATLAQTKALGYAAQLAEENKRFGLEYIADDRARAAATLELDAQVWRERIALAGDGTEAQKRLQEEFDTWYRNQSIKPQLDEQKKMWDGIESAAHDTFLSIEDGAKSAAERAKQALRNGLFEWLWQMAAKPIYLDIRSALSSGGPSIPGISSGVGSAAGSAGANPLINAANAASSVYKAFSGGLANLGSTIGNSISQLGTTLGSNALQSFGHGMNGFAATGEGAQALGVNSTWATAGNYAGTAAGYGAGMLAGHYIGNAIAGDYSMNHGQAVTNTATVIGAIVGGPIGAAIGGALGGLANRAFGMGSKEVQTTGISGTLSSNGTTASSYSKWHQNGGWFRSDKNGTDSTAFSSDTIAALTNGLNQLKAVSSGFAASLGVDASSIEDYTKAFNIDLGKDGKIEDGITKLLTNVSDELATSLVPNILQFAKTGETASGVLERLAGDFSATTQTAQLVGKTSIEAFGAAGIASAAAREHLIDLAGSASNLTSWASSYAQNYLSEGEKLVPVRKAVDEAMSSLGLAWVTTREQFKQVVDSLDLTTDAGARQFTSMMQLADAFAQVHAASDSLLKTEAQIADERKDLQNQLDQLTLTSAELLEKQRSALDETNRALFDQVQTAQKVKTAQDAAKTSLGNLISQMQSFATTASGLNNSLLLGDLSTLTPQQQLEEARRQFEKTRQAAYAGDANAQGNLQSIEQTFLQLSQKLNGGDANYSSDLATVMRTNDDLARWAGDSVDVAQASLNALTDQSATLQDISATLTTIAQGVQQQPNLLTGAGTPIFPQVYAPNIDYSRIGTLDMAPLVAEVKALREEVKALRAEALRRTGDLIQAGAASAQQAAETVVEGVEKAITDAAYAEANSTREIK